MQQVGPGPEIWRRASQSPAPRPVLRGPAARTARSRANARLQRRRRRLVHRTLTVVGSLLLGVAVYVSYIGISGGQRPHALLAQVERLAEAGGLGLQQVSLTGHDNTTDVQVFDAIDLSQARTLLSFDAKAAQARVEALPWVARASIERVLPDRLEVRITERIAFAVWRLGERAFLIDKTGRVLAPVKAQSVAALPQVAGEGAAAEAAALIDRLAAYPQLARHVELAERVGGRRWTLRLAGGTAVHLPADGEAEALRWLSPLAAPGLQRISEIDLRVPRRILVRERQDGGASAPRAGDLALPAGRG